MARVGQVGIHVGRREAVLDVERRSVSNAPEAGRSVVPPQTTLTGAQDSDA